MQFATVGRIVHFLPFGSTVSDDVECGTFRSTCQAALIVDVEPVYPEQEADLCVYRREAPGITFEHDVPQRPWPPKPDVQDRMQCSSWHFPVLYR